VIRLVVTHHLETMCKFDSVDSVGVWGHIIFFDWYRNDRSDIRRIPRHGTFAGSQNADETTHHFWGQTILGSGIFGFFQDNGIEMLTD